MTGFAADLDGATIIMSDVGPGGILNVSHLDLSYTYDVVYILQRRYDLPLVNTLMSVPCSKSNAF